MTQAGAVVALVLYEWAVGLIGGAAWTQSWSVVKRGHFRIVAWTALVLAGLGLLAERNSIEDASAAGSALSIALVGAAIAYLVSQYLRSERVGAVTGGLAAGVGVLLLIETAGLLSDWAQWFAALQLISGALLVGAVTNGMLLGHWYLNQPGLKPWALARLTTLGLVAAGLSGALGIAAAPKLTEAQTQGAVLGLPGFGEDFGLVFFITWVVLLAFTAGVVWMARRCVRIRSIQSATGLYYVALLTAGVSEFLVRYLMVNTA